MPLVHYLAINIHLPIGWHRIHERRARGVNAITLIATQLDGWEHQLVSACFLLIELHSPSDYIQFCKTGPN
jgi:hypothetical protein